MDKYVLALEEIRNNFRLQCEGVDNSKQSARSSINSSGLMIALISLLKEKKSSPFNLGFYNIEFWAWIVTIALFLIMVIIYVLAINPIGMNAPVESTKERFDEVFIKPSDKKSIKILINEYRETIIANRPILKKVSSLAKWTNWLAALSIFSAFLIFLFEYL